MEPATETTAVEIIHPKKGKLVKHKRLSSKVTDLPTFAEALRARAADEDLFRTLSPHGQLIVPRVLNELARLLDPDGKDGEREQLTAVKRIAH